MYGPISSVDQKHARKVLGQEMGFNIIGEVNTKNTVLIVIHAGIVLNIIQALFGIIKKYMKTELMIFIEFVLFSPHMKRVNKGDALINHTFKVSLRIAEYHFIIIV